MRNALSLAFASALDPGRLRHNNEDALCVDAAAGVAVLADGMGGYNAGEVAASMATSLTCGHLARWRRAQAAEPTVQAWSDAMVEGVAAANQAVFDKARAYPRCHGMGATLVAAVLTVRGRGALVAHLGDSRAYLMRGTAMRRLTRDHSVLQNQIDAGLITDAQAASSPYRSFITQAVGIEPRVKLPMEHHPLEPGDMLLLCSDGLTDMVDDPTIAAILRVDEALDRQPARLIEAANEAGGRDNIAVILIRVGL